jgi:hypothetical protein
VIALTLELGDIARVDRLDARRVVRYLRLRPGLELTIGDLPAWGGASLPANR